MNTLVAVDDVLIVMMRGPHYLQVSVGCVSDCMQSGAADCVPVTELAVYSSCMRETVTKQTGSGVIESVHCASAADREISEFLGSLWWVVGVCRHFILGEVLNIILCAPILLSRGGMCGSETVGNSSQSSTPPLTAEVTSTRPTAKRGVVRHSL